MSIDGDGNFSGTSDVNGTDISGTVDNGVVAGTYSNSDTGASGTLEGGIESEPSPFAGTYSGNWSGSGHSGSWQMTIYEDGRTEGEVFGGGTGEGGVDSEGRVIDFTTGGSGGFGTISDGSYSGVWVNTTNGDTGTMTATLVDTEAGGGGGGGGCFIKILTQ